MAKQRRDIGRGIGLADFVVDPRDLARRLAFGNLAQHRHDPLPRFAAPMLAERTGLLLP